MHNIPRAMFVLMPLLAFMMTGMYWRPRRYYIAHLPFFVHNHAFILLLFSLVILTVRVLPETLGKALMDISWLYLPYYLFISMRRVYGQSRWRTFTKLTVLSFSYFIIGVVTLAMTLVYSDSLAQTSMSLTANTELPTVTRARC